jgi:succinate dehydrogenase hydrophobic anchor subunit
MDIVLTSVLLVSSIAVLYFMYRSLTDDAREWVETFSKIALAITLLVVAVASTSHLLTCGIK